MAILGAVMGAASIASGVMGMIGGSKNRKAGAAAIKAADPFGPERRRYQLMLRDIMTNPAGFLNNPLYRAAFEQGSQAVERGMAAKGYAGSGNMAAALQEFGMGFGWNALQEQERFLAQLAGAQIAPNPGPGLQMMQSGTNDMYGGFSSIMTGIGGLGKFFGSSGGGGGGGGTITYGPGGPR